MSQHIAKLLWERGETAFDYKSYSRNHQWDFGQGETLTASAAAAYLGDPSKVDPEQAFVASLSSCHMLTFLALCAMRKLTIERYEDEAIGYLGKNDKGKIVITKVELRPKVTFAPGIEVDRVTLERLHTKGHEECFLANSVNCQIITVLD